MAKHYFFGAKHERPHLFFGASHVFNHLYFGASKDVPNLSQIFNLPVQEEPPLLPADEIPPYADLGPYIGHDIGGWGGPPNWEERQTDIIVPKRETPWYETTEGKAVIGTIQGIWDNEDWLPKQVTKPGITIEESFPNKTDALRWTAKAILGTPTPGPADAVGLLLAPGAMAAWVDDISGFDDARIGALRVASSVLSYEFPTGFTISQDLALLAEKEADFLEWLEEQGKNREFMTVTYTVGASIGALAYFTKGHPKLTAFGMAVGWTLINKAIKSVYNWGVEGIWNTFQESKDALHNMDEEQQNELEEALIRQGKQISQVDTLIIQWQEWLDSYMSALETPKPSAPAWLGRKRRKYYGHGPQNRPTT